MIAHLAGRETALEPFGWTGRKAEWPEPSLTHLCESGLWENRTSRLSS